MIVRSLACCWLATIGLAGCGGPSVTAESSAGGSVSSPDAGPPVVTDAETAGEAETAPVLALVAIEVLESAAAPPEAIREAVRDWIEVLTKLGLREQAIEKIDGLAAQGELSEREREWLAKRYVDLGMIEEATRVVGELELFAQRSVLGHGVRVNAAAGSCDAVRRFVELFPKGVSTSYALEQLAECLARTGEHEAALEIIDNCEGSGSEIYSYTMQDEPYLGCQISKVLEIYVRELATGGDLAGAVALVDARSGDLRDEVSSHYHHMNWESALKSRDNTPRWTGEELGDAIESATAVESARLLGHVIEIGLELGKLDEALAIIGEVDEGPNRDGLKIRAATKLAQTGASERALEVARSAIGKSARAHALVAVSKELAGGGAREQRLAILGEAFALVRKGKETRERFTVLRPIALELADVGDLDQAWKAFRAIKSLDARCSIDTDFARALAAGKQFGRAEKVVESCYLDDEELGEYLAACVRAGGHERAVVLANRQSKRKSRDLGYGAVASLAKACVLAETCRPVLEVLDRIGPDGHREYARFAAGQRYAESGRVDEALEILETVSQYRKQQLVAEIIASLIRAGDQQRAIEVARSFDDSLGSSAAAAVASAFADAGDERQALEWADRSGYSGGFRFWLRLAEGLLSRGEHRRAAECLELIWERPAGEWEHAPVPWQVDEALQRAAAEHAAEGRFERALLLLSFVSSDEKRVRRIGYLAHDVEGNDEPALAPEPDLLRLVAERVAE